MGRLLLLREHGLMIVLEAGPKYYELREAAARTKKFPEIKFPDGFVEFRSRSFVYVVKAAQNSA